MKKEDKQFFVALLVFNFVFILLAQLLIINPPDFLKSKKIYRKTEINEKR
jgi:hypothetical protein